MHNFFFIYKFGLGLLAPPYHATLIPLTSTRFIFPQFEFAVGVLIEGHQTLFFFFFHVHCWHGYKLVCLLNTCMWIFTNTIVTQLPDITRCIFWHENISYLTWYPDCACGCLVEKSDSSYTNRCIFLIFLTIVVIWTYMYIVCMSIWLYNVNQYHGLGIFRRTGWYVLIWTFTTWL